MSRSNPNDNTPNPAEQWYEWNGENGVVRYYDKADKENVDLPFPFSFLLLDELSSVRGWHEASKSAIYSNEVKDTRTNVFIVKAFKGGVLAEGLYKDIKDRVNSIGARFVANLYIAVLDDSEPNDNQWHIASLRLKGAALGAWMEFRKANRSHLYNSAILITGSESGKKGRIVFHMPTFELEDITPATNSIAVELDKEFQAWLEGYLRRRVSDRLPPPQDEREPEDNTPLIDDDIPF